MDFKTNRIQCNTTEIFLLTYEDFDPSSYIENLTPIEIERYHTFKNIGRKREFVATRILRCRNLGADQILYDPNGAPFIKGEGFISVSHSGDTVGLAINKNHSVGLDIEFPRKNILKIKSKFLSEREMQLFDCTNPDVVTKLWSAKEALYKLAGRKEILFIEELLLSKTEDGLLSGTIINPDHELYVKLDIFERNGMFITINTDEVERNK
ncbi:MAG: 4'-phosphopantetheinyl transferase superfamily protein [Flavobacteriales bacterium]|nr:4'-phosphopantetheinyl transferase superfamily protein [Flavobacteriales bacterium]